MKKITFLALAVITLASCKKELSAGCGVITAASAFNIVVDGETIKVDNLLTINGITGEVIYKYKKGTIYCKH